MTGQISQKSMTLAKVFSLEELEEMKRRMDQAMDAESQQNPISAPNP